MVSGRCAPGQPAHTRVDRQLPGLGRGRDAPRLAGLDPTEDLVDLGGFIRGFSLRACRSGKEQDGGEPEQGGCDPDMQFHMTSHTGIIGFRTAGVVTLR